MSISPGSSGGVRAVVWLLTACSVGAAGRDLPLIDAVKSGDAVTVHRLVREHADVNAAEADGTTALHWAAHRNDLDTLVLLLRAGGNAKAVNRYGVSPLSLASENGSAPVITRLLEAGADPNTVEGEGQTVLMTAARTGDVEAMAALLARGAKVDATERWRGQTALMWAAIENNPQALQLLLDRGASPGTHSSGGFTALLFASRAGHLDAARVLVDAGVNPDEALPDGTSALLLAVTNAHYELAAFLLDRGADPTLDGVGWTALHQVAMTRRPNTGGNLSGAIPTGSISSLELVEKLLSHGANPNARQRAEYPKTGYLSGYRQLLNRVGATPFLLAAWGADVELMRVLAAHGADPLLPNAEHTTPVMVAAGVGLWSVGESPGTDEEAAAAVKLCLQLGADVTAADDNGYTALHGAAHRGSNSIVELLVEHGARLDATLTKAGGGNVGWQAGWTPLAIAEGVFYANTFKRHPDTAALLRRFMSERGMSTEPSSPGGPAGATSATPRTR